MAALEFYLSGGAANSDPAASLGGSISNTQATGGLNGLFDHVSDAEASAGDVEYRCIYVKNPPPEEGHSGIKLSVWISAETASADSIIDIGIDPAGRNGTATTIASEQDAPAGVTFSHPTANWDGLKAELARSDVLPIWLRRTITAGAAATDDSFTLEAAKAQPPPSPPMPLVTPASPGVLSSSWAIGGADSLETTATFGDPGTFDATAALAIADTADFGDAGTFAATVQLNPAAAAFEIINAGLAGVDSGGLALSQPWTTAADTTLLVVCVHCGATGFGDTNFASLSFNGVAMTEIGQSAGDLRNNRPGQQWWYLKDPPIGSFDLTFTLESSGDWDGDSFYVIQAFNIRGEAAAPIGATAFPVTTPTDNSSFTSSITTTAADSILLAGVCWQNATATITPLEGLTELTEDASGVSSSLDGVAAIGWKQVAAAASHDYGWQVDNPDGGGITAIEIKKG